MVKLSDKLLSKKEVCEITGFTFQTIWRWMKEGKFPQSLRTNFRRTVWRKEDVDQWMEDVIAEKTP